MNTTFVTPKSLARIHVGDDGLHVPNKFRTETPIAETCVCKDTPNHCKIYAKSWEVYARFLQEDCSAVGRAVQANETSFVSKGRVWQRRRRDDRDHDVENRRPHLSMPYKSYRDSYLVTVLSMLLAVGGCCV